MSTPGMGPRSYTGTSLEGAGVSVGAAASGVVVSGGVVAVGGGWQAPRPANKARTRKQLNTDRLENIPSLPSPMKKLL